MRRMMVALTSLVAVVGVAERPALAAGDLAPTFVAAPTSSGTTVAIVVTGGGGGSVTIPLTCEVRAFSWHGFGHVISDTSELRVGTRVWSRCWPVGGTPTPNAFTLIRWDPADPPPVPPALLGEIAVAQLVVPLPEPEVSPPADNQLTGLTTWLHLPDWADHTVTATAGGVSVTAHASPTRATWRFPDGTVTCNGSGTAWTAGTSAQPSCAHTPTTASFTRDEPDELSVSVSWDRWWTSTTGVTTNLPALTRTTTVPLTIREYQVTTR